MTMNKHENLLICIIIIAAPNPVSQTSGKPLVKKCFQVQTRIRNVPKFCFFLLLCATDNYEKKYLPCIVQNSTHRITSAKMVGEL